MENAHQIPEAEASAPKPEAPANHAVYGDPRMTAPKRNRLGFHLTMTEVAVFMLVLNLFAVGALYLKTEKEKAPVMATVSVTSLARGYEERFANDPTATPEVVKLQTNIFMASAEQAVKEMSAKQHMLILARECVLAGEAKDLTPDLTPIIDSALKKNGQPAAGGGDVSPFHVQ